MIKNYCIKIISSVFIMLTIFMVSSSVFATTLNICNVSETERSSYLRENVESKYISLNAPFADEISNYQMYCTGESYADYFLFVTGLNGYKVSHLQIANIGNGPYFQLVDTNGNIMANENFRVVGIYYSSSSGWAISSYTKYEDYNRLLYYSRFFNNSELSVVDTDGTVIYEGAYTVDLTEKKIIYEVNYSEDNKTAILSAEIKNGAEGDKLYYSTLGYSITGKLMNPIELNQSQATAITLIRNTMIHLQALDSEREYYRYRSE